MRTAYFWHVQTRARARDYIPEPAHFGHSGLQQRTRPRHCFRPHSAAGLVGMPLTLGLVPDKGLMGLLLALGSSPHSVQ